MSSLTRPCAPALAGLALLAVSAAPAAAETARARMSPYNEVPAVSSTAEATFRATVSPDRQSIDYELTYAGLEADATQAHLHFGQRDVNGGISVWLCANPSTTPPVVTPPAGFDRPCPLRAGTVTGEIEPDDVVGPAGQGIEPGAFEELLAALRAGKVYANVHSKKFPGGEIRGQVKGSRRHE
jgi:hypothetical protein